MAKAMKYQVEAVKLLMTKEEAKVVRDAVWHYLHGGQLIVREQERTSAYEVYYSLIALRLRP